MLHLFFSFIIFYFSCTVYQDIDSIDEPIADRNPANPIGQVTPAVSSQRHSSQFFDQP